MSILFTLVPSAPSIVLNKLENLTLDLEKEMQPTPVFLPGESLGQRSLVDYTPWGHKESDMTEVTYHACTQPWINICERYDVP